MSTFDRIQTQVFDVSCSSQACHSSVARAGDLILERGHSWDSLVNRLPDNRVSAESGMMRVMPGDPDRSFLFSKLTGNLAPGQGSSMPRGLGVFGPKTLAVVRAWIEAGAPLHGLVPGDDGSDLGDFKDVDDEPELPPPPRGVQLRATAPPIPRGRDETTCHYFKLPSDVDIDVNRIQISVRGGSHHIHLYRPLDSSVDVADHTEVCNGPVDFGSWGLVVATQNVYTDWELPPGVVFHFRAGQQLLMQTHFNNVGSLETIGEGKAVINLHSIPPEEVQHYAGALWAQDRDVLVPPRSNTTQSSVCIFPKEVNLIAETGHYHFRGRRFINFFWENGVRGEIFYYQEGYDDPPFLIHDPPLHFAPGTGFEWECYWENDTDREFRFGPSTEDNEHCFVFAFYYPADSDHEAMTCLRENNEISTIIKHIE